MLPPWMVLPAKCWRSASKAIGRGSSPNVGEPTCKINEEGTTFLEIADTQTFYNEFFKIFGKDRFSVGRYEEDDNQGSFIERFWPGFLLIEQKRTNVNVDLKIAKEKSHRLCKNLSENKCPRCIN
ncbi:MAG: hypothetical protein F4226_10020 [Synechococcus sp. SB0678_bin_12]|nr:hypothetical protein [Synechococcus sp. SB0678_bin_12]